MDEIAGKFMKDDDARSDVLAEAESKAESLDNPKYELHPHVLHVYVIHT